MKLSVIIPTRNHCALLERTLESISRQDFTPANFEVIVVDNGSTDATEQVCAVWQKRLVSFRRVYAPEPGLHVGRNMGMLLAQDPILVYCDDDIQAEPQWLNSIAKAFEDPEVGLAGGNNLPHFESAPPPWLEGLKQRYEFGWAIPPLSLLDFGTKPRQVGPQHVWGCNYSIDRNLLSQIGGFHPDGMPNDLLHLRGDGESYVSQEVLRRGRRIVFAPGATIRHFTPAARTTLDYLSKRGHNQGISKTYTIVRNSGGLRFTATARILATILKACLVAATASNPGKRALFSGYARGIWRHWRHCRKNPQTVAWINRDTYLPS